MNDAPTTITDYIENLDTDNVSIRVFLICSTSNIPLWTPLYHFLLRRTQLLPMVHSHCLVGVLDTTHNKLHYFECDWFQGLTHSVVCDTVYVIPRDEPYTVTICVDKTGGTDHLTKMHVVECTHRMVGVTLTDILSQVELAKEMSPKRMTPLTLLRVYLDRAVDRFVCTSFAQFLLEPHMLRFQYPLTVDELKLQLTNSHQ